MNVTFFHRPESNRVDPRTLPCKPIDLEVPDDFEEVEELLSYAYSLGVPKGSARCGCVEIQTDDGIWSSHHGGRIVPSKAVFKTWEQLEAEELN